MAPVKQRLTWARRKLGQGMCGRQWRRACAAKSWAADCGQGIGAEQCQNDPRMGAMLALGSRARFMAVARRPVADFALLFENMAGGTNAELRQRVEQLEALVGQAVEVGTDSSVLARMARFEAGDDPAESSHSKSDGSKDKAKEWKKSGKGQAAEVEGFSKNGRKAETSNGKESNGKFKGCFTCGGPHLKKDCLVQAREIAMLATEKQEQVAEANAIVADANGATGALYVNNPLGLIN
ncbi:hypothetical protein A4A49_56978 [Nicotiana attenuata]|uniref:Uncharacterized protein n=1 Tax=Nicotiana attenuata TaxID=49451 RepID=A0A1J6KXD9_NICAT|nr:hypothetical protein A4A49_56978 [Nicotiana attenuata]